MKSVNIAMDVYKQAMGRSKNPPSAAVVVS